MGFLLTRLALLINVRTCTHTLRARTHKDSLRCHALGPIHLFLLDMGSLAGLEHDKQATQTGHEPLRKIVLSLTPQSWDHRCVRQNPAHLMDAQKDQSRMLDPLEPAVMSHPPWVLGTKQGSLWKSSNGF